ncbi:MAG: hypothetical protein CNIPEHKO_00475 [Anaerolineales bacterium]|nr:hypothetical protein [Anaerolineales bacterium]
MTSIGVIDDRNEERQIIVGGIRFGKNDDAWNIVDSKPLTSLEEYPAWIGQNKICVLVIDELLDEKINGGVAVEYKGHNLVDYIRQRLPTLPIFVITSYSNDPSLLERFKDVEGIVERQDFSSNYKDYVPRIIRAAQQYLNVFQEELNELASFAQRIATGEPLSYEEQTRAQAIQTKLDIAYSINAITDISNWLDEATTLVSKIQELRKEIEKKLGKQE